MGKPRGVAIENIKFGALVLVRRNEVRNATADIANATAGTLPRWRGQTRHRKGDWLICEPLAELGARCLQAIADGPIMDSNQIYLPAGKLTTTEYQERLSLQFRDAGIEDTPHG